MKESFGYDLGTSGGSCCCCFCCRRSELARYASRPVLLRNAGVSGFVCFISPLRIERQLVEASLLTTPEREWLDDYHATVLDTLGPLLKDRDMEAYQYLVRETRPIGSGQN